RDEAALVVPQNQRRPGIGAEINLPRDHLLHGEVAGRYAELFELDAALFQETRAQQVIGRHAPQVRLVALTDDGLRECAARREGRTNESCARSEIMPAADLHRHRSPPLWPLVWFCAACPR